MVTVNKTVFFVGETVIIEGKIEPPPENRNIQLMRYYWCRDHYWRAGDLWTTCNAEGYFKFSFSARIIEPAPGYCNIGYGGKQSQKFRVRYQPREGAPPTTYAEAEITVINAKPPVGEISKIIAIYNNKEYNLYPAGEKLTVKYNDKFKIKLTLANTGGYKAKLYFHIIDAETGETVVSPAITPVEVAPGGAFEGEVEITMPEKETWNLKIVSGYVM